MAKEFSRSDRVAEQIQRELADLLQFEVKDPRVSSMVTVTEVEISGDMAHAKIYYTAPQGTPELQKGLEKTAGFLRSQLAKRLLLRTVPQLHFSYDASIDRGMHIAKLIDEVLPPSAPDQDDESA
ncbi:30S ribosome-binding factor RbfA [Methylobacillus flagellatus]|uniref:30S ribosome-binding factor RbfA n=1 Tax=Methylobacillus flagellatus TaxID=405 RepID=UPI002853F44A|nr:30S ribosome-binding factor RbfA [Methylobacillus flagellatus]MDR5172907.1 30S ribosome-binding factor RbfA [Methylobacillus flagellatus]